MKKNKILLAILAIALVLGMTSCGDAGGGGGNDVSSVDTGEDYIEIGNCILKIPTADEEFLYLMNILELHTANLLFDTGYNGTKPIDPAVDAYIAACINATYEKVLGEFYSEFITDYDDPGLVAAYKALKKAFYERIYKREDYVKGFNAFKAAFTTFAAQAVPVYAKYERIWGELPLPAPFIKNGKSYGYEGYWGLHVPEKYIIQLSLYGNNGEYVSYSSDGHRNWEANAMLENGEIDFDTYSQLIDDSTIIDTIFVTVLKTGHKGNYITPLELIIHETGHQALSNVDYFVWLVNGIERLNDLFIIRLFGKTLIPKYRAQNISSSIEEIFENADVLERLPQYLMEFGQKYGLPLHPRGFDW